MDAGAEHAVRADRACRTHGEVGGIATGRDIGHRAVVARHVQLVARRGRVVHGRVRSGGYDLADEARRDLERVSPGTGIAQRVRIGSRNGVAANGERRAARTDRARTRHRQMRIRHHGDEGHVTTVVRRARQLVRERRRSVDREDVAGRDALVDGARRDLQREGPGAGVAKGVSDRATELVTADREVAVDRDHTCGADLEVRGIAGVGTEGLSAVRSRRAQLAPIGRRTVNGAGVGHEPDLGDRARRDTEREGPGSGVAVDVGVGAAEGVVADHEHARGGDDALGADQKVCRVAAGGGVADRAVVARDGEWRRVGAGTIDGRRVARRFGLGNQAGRDGERVGPGAGVAETIGVGARDRVVADSER